MPSTLLRQRSLSAVLLGTALTCHAAPAAAQQTFHLDRLEVPGGPADGAVLFRPTASEKPLVFGQLGIGYQLHPLRTSTLTSDEATKDRSSLAVIDHQLALYANAGFELFGRGTVGVAFPFYPLQLGQNPLYSAGAGAVPSGGLNGTTPVRTEGPATGDLRLDLRGVVLRSDDQSRALGAQLHVFVPTGTTNNFGGNGIPSAMVMVSGETRAGRFILTANTGVHLRPRQALNNPVRSNGLGISDELRWALGAFLPLHDGKYRLGATVFGQTGIAGGSIVGDTFLTMRNTPIEFSAEGRMRFGDEGRWWFGASAGTAILRGYGAPDLRVVAMLGMALPILESDAGPPDRATDIREKRRNRRTADRDNDGIPDDVDACPDEPEDHLGSDPRDGCPVPKDRDGDGIPDAFDKCPDKAEDFDGIDDGDGCPEDDADHDGIPDAVDHCPKTPGKPSSDPALNGCPSHI